MRKRYLIFDRLLAFIYDLIFLSLSLLILILGLNFINNRFYNFGNLKNWIIILISFFVYLLDFVALPLILNGTIGKYLTELEIEPTHGKITFGRMLFREVVLKHLLYLSLVGFMVECIYYLVRKQTIHDYLLKTTVIYKEI